MAHENRLLDQQQYLKYVHDMASLKPKQMLLATWGLRLWNSEVSPVLLALRALPDETQILVGFGNSNDVGRSASVAGRFKNLRVRFTTGSHAKYILAQDAATLQWFGALGSSNLSDSSQFNISTTLSSAQAERLAARHRLLWASALEHQAVFAKLRDLRGMSDTIYEANDTREAIRG